MRKQEFLDSLEQLLWDLKEEDRREAMQYYIDYFEDAGISEEQDVIEEFGRPEKVAARIKVEMTEEHSEYSEQGFEDIRFEENSRTMLKPAEDAFQKEEWETVGEDVIQKKEKKEKKKLKPGILILIVALAVFAAPVLLPLILGAAALLLGLLLGAIALIGSLLLGGLAVILSIALGGLASGGILIVHGIIRLFTLPAMGAISLGVGSLFFAAGIIAALALIWMTLNLFPKVLKGTKNLFTKLTHKGGKRDEEIL